MPVKASYHTLGCKLNFSETATIANILKQKGIERISDGQTPHLCVVNTCSVTENADKKSRQLVRNLAKKYPEASIIVTGCYAQLKPEEASALPNVVLVLGSNEKLRISQFIDSWMQTGAKQAMVIPGLQITTFMPSCERGERTRYFLKVQDGCDYFCTYCTIPFARGRSRSGTISELTEMARKAAKEGGKEIVITGVNIGTFGKDHGEDFFTLLKALDKVEGIERYRISSIEPNLLTDEILNWIATESRAFVHHFHIPLQSGSDKVLKLMNRRYDTALFKSRIDKIRSLMPDAFIGVDVIAGARGETQTEWDKSLSFIHNLDITKLHAFPYSERKGTKALLLEEDVAKHIRYERVGELNKLSEEKTRQFIISNIGKRKKVLWEKIINGKYIQGLTDNYIRVEADYTDDLINQVSEVEIIGLKEGNSEIAIAKHYE